MEKDTNGRTRRKASSVTKTKVENKKISKSQAGFKVLKKPGNFTLVFSLTYIMLIIMSIIGRVSTLKYTSTTEVTFGAVMGEFLMPMLVAALLIVTSIVYYKNRVYGAAIEIAVGLSMVVDVFVSVFTAGFDFLALLLTLIIPSILIIHSILILKNIKKENKKSA